jgi:phospholipid transport system substrate-binding protein
MTQITIASTTPLIRSFVRFARCLVVAVLLGIATGPHPAAADDTGAAFIRALGTQAFAVIRRPDMLPDAKIAYFADMIRQDFDLSGICRFVLGPYWRVASPAEQQEFSNLFTQRLINFYGHRLGQTGSADFVVTGSRAEADGVVVTSQIIPQQGAPIVVSWRLGVSDAHYRIKDVEIDGVSMIATQRSEIADLLARRGGQLAQLLVTMRQEG